MTEFDNTSMLPSAEALRRAIRRKEQKEIEARRHLEEEKARQLHDLAEDFLIHHLTEAELAEISRRVAAAVRAEQFEALVYTFPSDLCTDSGRAINNRDADWPDSLQGKARELYERYVQVARPAGYRLKAKIISFPDGMPGDVGLYLSWEPDPV